MRARFPAAVGGLWRRPEARFIILFTTILVVSFAVLALRPVNDAVVDPYTGLVAKMAATADLVAGGRLILGLGCGWHDPEYEAFGYPIDHRVGRFAEALEIVARLLRGERVTVEGRYHRVRDAALEPPPERRIPILVAAFGPRMLDLTARWADAWNTAWYGGPDRELADAVAALDVALAAAGRDPASMVRTVGMVVRDPEQPPVAEPEPDAFTGPVEALATMLRSCRALGIDHLIVGLEPISERSVERLAEATRRSRG